MHLSQPRCRVLMHRMPAHRVRHDVGDAFDDAFDLQTRVVLRIAGNEGMDRVQICLCLR